MTAKVGPLCRRYCNDGDESAELTRSRKISMVFTILDSSALSCFAVSGNCFRQQEQTALGDSSSDATPLPLNSTPPSQTLPNSHPFQLQRDLYTSVNKSATTSGILRPGWQRTCRIVLCESRDVLGGTVGKLVGWEAQFVKNAYTNKDRLRYISRACVSKAFTP